MWPETIELSSINILLPFPHQLMTLTKQEIRLLLTLTQISCCPSRLFKFLERDEKRRRQAANNFSLSESEYAALLVQSRPRHLLDWSLFGGDWTGGIRLDAYTYWVREDSYHYLCSNSLWMSISLRIGTLEVGIR